MTSQYIGIEEARRALGDLVTAAAGGTDVTIARNRRPVATLTRYQPPTEITLAELTAQLGFSANDAAARERIARFAGAFTVTSEYTRTGRIPPRWAGQGTDAKFTRDEAAVLIGEWNRAEMYADGMAYLNGGQDSGMGGINEARSDH